MVAKQDEKLGIITSILSLNQDIVRMADTKSSFLIGISGLILSLIVQMDKTYFSPLKLYIIYVSIFLLTFSTISQMIVIYPRSNGNVNERNTIYYKGILKFNRDRYLEYIKESSQDRILTDYIHSTYDLAAIQDIKYKWLKIGLISLVLAISLISVSIFL